MSAKVIFGPVFKEWNSKFDAFPSESGFILGREKRKERCFKKLSDFCLAGFGEILSQRQLILTLFKGVALEREKMRRMYLEKLSCAGFAGIEEALNQLGLCFEPLSADFSLEGRKIIDR